MRNAKVMQSKSKIHTVTHLGGCSYEVTSGASGNRYTVRVSEDMSRTACSCNWAQYRPAGSSCACSHVLSVVDFITRQGGRRVSAWSDETQAARQHKPVVNIGDGIVLTTRKVAA